MDYGRPWFQIQVLAAAPTSLTAEQDQQVQMLFLQMRDLLKQKCLQSVDAEG